MRKGQVLIELMLALAVTTLALLAMVGLATKSLSTVGSSKYRAQASTYATQGMEWVRQQRMADWSAFVSKSGATQNSFKTYCVPLGLISSWPLEGGCSGTGYLREVTLTSISLTPPQKIQADVVVRWSEGSRSPSTKQTTIFTDY